MAVSYFGGCSFTQGTGFDQEKNDPRIYPNLLTSEAINDAEGGSSNLKIFTRAAKALIDNSADAYVVQWSALHRHWLYPTPDSGYYIGSPGDDKNKFVVEFQKLNHDYGNILQLIDYVRILEDLAKFHGVPIVFVNGLIEWSNDTNWIYNLVSDAKDNHNQFVENLNNNIELVDWNNWANPWHSMLNLNLDTAPLDNHPGPKTHQYIAELVKEKLNERLPTRSTTTVFRNYNKPEETKERN